MATTINVPVRHVHLDAFSIAQAINACVANNALKVGVNGAITTQAGGAQAARTDYFRFTWVGPNGSSMPSPETSGAVALNSVGVLAAPANPPSWATGWQPYASTVAGAETAQGPVLALGTNYVEPNTGFVAGAALPTVDTSYAKAKTVHLDVGSIKKQISAVTGVAYNAIVLNHLDGYAVANAINTAVSAI